MGTDQTAKPFRFEPVKRSQSLAADVATQLEQMVTQGHINVGEKLPTESKLCDMFGVSRTVVREAITQLKSLGLVETRRGVGTTVIRNQPAEAFPAYSINPTAVEDILHILELRLSIEPAAAQLAAARRNADDIAHLEQCLKDYDTALEKGELARKEDLAFHMSIASATKNPFFRRFYEQLNTNIIPRAKIVNSNMDHGAAEAYLHRVRKEHLMILDAIRSGDEETARATMYNHLFQAYQVYEQYRTDKS